MNVATIVIPVGPYHEAVAARAAASAQAQSVPVDVLIQPDTAGRGAGWARNQGARKVDTPLLVFLDADDVLEPGFAEGCLRAYVRGQYVYTGWYVNGRVKLPAACNPYANGGYHLVTTLYPTAAFRALGGFNEDLPGHEDTEFYLRSARAGLCGRLVNKALLHYSSDGQRSARLQERGDYADIVKQVYENAGGEITVMGCGCGGSGGVTPEIANQKQDGDVLARALWSGIRTESGPSGRVYRGGNGQQMWVAPQDVAAKPKLWEVVPAVADLTPEREDVLALAGLV